MRTSISGSAIRRPEGLEPAGRCPGGLRPGDQRQSETRARAFEELLIAEGSDCVGGMATTIRPTTISPSTSCSGAPAQVYRLLDSRFRTSCFVSNISAAAPTAAETRPPASGADPRRRGIQLLRVARAAASRCSRLSAAMHQTERPRTLLAEIQFGFDREHLHVRLTHQTRPRPASERHSVLVAVHQPGRDSRGRQARRPGDGRIALGEGSGCDGVDRRPSAASGRRRVDSGSQRPTSRH